MHLTQRPKPRPRPNAGFTLIELIIVIIILGVLAAIIIPQFISAASASKENSLKMNLFRIRQQIDVYKNEHGHFPLLDFFAEQMTEPTDQNGNPVPIGTPGSLGPYLRTIPANPMTDTRDISDGNAGTSAWYYNELTGDFHANDSTKSRAY